MDKNYIFLLKFRILERFKILNNKKIAMYKVKKCDFQKRNLEKSSKKFDNL